MKRPAMSGRFAFEPFIWIDSMPTFRGFHYLAGGSDREGTPLLLLRGSSMDKRDLLPLMEDVASEQRIYHLKAQLNGRRVLRSSERNPAGRSTTTICCNRLKEQAIL
jgi:hypothetical protein